MKKLLNIFLLPLLTLAFTACDYNEQFEGLDEMEKIKNVAKYEYTITATDITTIANALNGNKNKADSLMATAVRSAGAFTDAAPASVLVPYALRNQFKAADKGSSALVTYAYRADRPAYLTQLSTGAYVLTRADYQAVWGADFVESLTPSKAPSAQIPGILASRFPTAVAGDYKNVEYTYSNQEPEMDVAEVFYLNTDFEGIANGSVPMVLPGWINKDLSGAVSWQCRVYSGNQYAQVTSNNSNAENEVWLVSPQVDLSQAANPKFSFYVTAGYYNAACLSIQISENFDGTIEGIAAATWTDVSELFTLPTGPATGYGTLGSAGNADLTAYAGKKVYVAFKYTGDGRGNVASTTFQLDNIKISEEKVTMTVGGTGIQRGVYQFTSGQWRSAGSNIIMLQPADYSAMGIGTYMTTANAPNYLPQFLALRFPYAQEGTVYTIVYKTSSSNYYNADEYLLTGGLWAQVSLVSTRTEQFVFASWAAGGWLFDPTVVQVIDRVSGNEPTLMKAIDYIHYQTPDRWYQKGTYINEEHYYGLNAYYAELQYGNDRITYGDPAIVALQGDDNARYALFDKRVAEIMPIFASLNYPEMKDNVSGIQQVLKIRILRYYSSSRQDYVEITLNCVKSGTGESNPAQFEFVSMEVVPTLR
jgi:hypothetical protein